MSSCKLVIKDEVNVKFENLDLKWRQKLSNKFRYQGGFENSVAIDCLDLILRNRLEINTSNKNIRNLK